MALSYKSRRRWSLFILVIGLPLYVVIAVNLVDSFANFAKVFGIFYVCNSWNCLGFPIKICVSGNWTI